MALFLVPILYDDQCLYVAATQQVSLVEKCLQNQSKLIVPALGKVSSFDLLLLLLYTGLGLD